ncbi:MAG: DUF1800 family protein [Planctomycetota bacterium]
MAGQWQVFRRLGLGPFRTLVGEVARGPAMIRWLDNETNVKGRANENFARELFELFTLGRDQGYVEADVKEAARAFTGWTIRKDAFWFDHSKHDGGLKRVLGHEGRLDGEAVLDLAVAHEACARHVAAKLLACFVGPAAPPEAVAELAAVFRAADGDVARCLEVLLGSELFFDPAQRGTRIRGPVEWILWVLRTLGLRASPRALHRAAARMGQALLEPPDVAGWDEEEAWISSATWIHRQNFAARLASAEGRPELRPGLEDVVPGDDDGYAYLGPTLFPDGLGQGSARAVARLGEAGRGLPREQRLAGLCETLWMLPEAHRF